MKTFNLEETYIKENVDIMKTFGLEETYTRRQGGLPRRQYRLAFFKSNWHVFPSQTQSSLGEQNLWNKYILKEYIFISLTYMVRAEKYNYGCLIPELGS